MKEKYIDEKVGLLYIFGSRPDGTVDVAAPHGDVFTYLPVETAERVVEANRAYREALYEILKDE